MTRLFDRRTAITTLGAGLTGLPACARAQLPPGLKLTFQEDFTKPEPVRALGSGGGRWKTKYWFGNQDNSDSRTLPDERQIYVDPGFAGINPFVASPAGLKIVAAPAPKGDPRLVNGYKDKKPLPYTSGIITTENSFRQRYGYFEAVMTFPQVRGCWPAFWLLGAPHSKHAGEEIDIVEWVASNPRRLFFTLHFGDKGGTKWVDGYDTSKPTAYGVLWTPEIIRWYVNGRNVHERPNPGFHQPMYMLINLAIGGWDNNLPEDPKGFPAALVVSGVKAYRLA